MDKGIACLGQKGPLLLEHYVRGGVEGEECCGMGDLGHVLIIFFYDDSGFKLLKHEGIWAELCHYATNPLCKC